MGNVWDITAVLWVSSRCCWGGCRCPQLIDIPDPCLRLVHDLRPFRCTAVLHRAGILPTVMVGAALRERLALACMHPDVNLTSVAPPAKSQGFGGVQSSFG